MYPRVGGGFEILFDLVLNKCIFSHVVSSHVSIKCPMIIYYVPKFIPQVPNRFPITILLNPIRKATPLTRGIKFFFLTGRYNLDPNLFFTYIKSSFFGEFVFWKNSLMSHDM